MSSKDKANVKDAYEELFHRLVKADLFKPEPELRLWNPKSGSFKKLKRLVASGADWLPGLYQDAYVAPLTRNLHAVWMRSRRTAETLAAAVYDHRPGRELVDSLKPLLAMISNVFRSFLEPERSAKKQIPHPKFWVSPLATFRPVLDKEDLEIFNVTPFVLPPNEVQRLCGGTVAVVSLPSNYREHPILCWASIAHEAGGHALLHAYPDLLRELKNSVRDIVGGNLDDPKGTVPESKKQFLGLLWQFWTEEAACDVFAVMNIGPVYGVVNAIYMAALSERIRRFRKDHKRKKPVPDDPGPVLNLSWPPEGSHAPYVNYHPTAILNLYVMIGAIEGLTWKNRTRKKQYIDAIKACVEVSLERDKNRGIPNDKVEITGSFEFRPGRLVHVNKGMFRIPRKEMFDIARKVGRHIANVSLNAFGNACIQDLETWDEVDEIVTGNIAEFFKKNRDRLIVPGVPSDWLGREVAGMGDDAQLLAGAIRALLHSPASYRAINVALQKALIWSFGNDPIWGHPTWHPLAGGPLERLDPAAATTTNQSQRRKGKKR